MNCVPGMITEFAFTPTITTEEMRMNSDVVDKVNRINKIRYENSKGLLQMVKKLLNLINLIIYYYVQKFVVLLITTCK